MRILYISKHFPGPFHGIASYFATQKNVTSLFLAEKNVHAPAIPNLRRLYLPTRLPAQNPKDSPPTERVMTQALRRGSHTANTLLKLRADGYYPDIIYTIPEDGYSLYIHDIFPKARIIIHARWFNMQGEHYTFFNQGVSRPPTEFALGRLANLLQFNIFSHTNLAISSSEWQKKQYPSELAAKITVLHDGVKTQLFKPLHETKEAEIVVYSCQGVQPARGIETLCKSLPTLLKQRPKCQVCLLSFQTSPSKNQQSIADCLPALPPEARARVHIVQNPKQQEYINILQCSSAYVYLTAPFTLSSGLHEAMSCGACVIASDTGPVLDTIRHAENGFLCNFWDADALANTVADVLARRTKLSYISHNAREYILEHHDYQTQIAKHADLILQK